MKSRLAIILAVSLQMFYASAIAAQAPSASSADPQAVWQALAKPGFDTAKSAQVSNLEITRDRIRITLISGAIRFAQPVNGIVTGAIFKGSGKLQVSAPDARETQQVQHFLRSDAVNLAFTEAAFSFTDGTFDEISAKVQWSAAGALSDDSYAARMEQRENLGFSFLPRLFQSVMAVDRVKNYLFLADVKTNDAGWVEAQFDSREQEEVSVGRYVEIAATYKNFDRWMSFPRTIVRPPTHSRFRFRKLIMRFAATTSMLPPQAAQNFPLPPRSRSKNAGQVSVFCSSVSIPIFAWTRFPMPKVCRLHFSKRAKTKTAHRATAITLLSCSAHPQSRARIRSSRFITAANA